jgi:hypothetical protein
MQLYPYTDPLSSLFSVKRSLTSNKKLYSPELKKSPRRQLSHGDGSTGIMHLCDLRWIWTRHLFFRKNLGWQLRFAEGVDLIGMGLLLLTAFATSTP